jgi:predicted DNA-binding transcriptional regulator YafY
VHRDIEALSLAGVPVYAERGRSGGFALLDGWRSSFGLTEPEIQALATARAAGALAELGLSRAFESGLLKLASSLPEVQRAVSEYTQARLYVDTSAWFSARESIVCLPLLREAVWQSLALSFSYQDFDGRRSERRVHPLGLVIKAERWYLVAKEKSQREPAVFRCGRITDAKLGAPFARPAKFQLASFWDAWSARFAQQRPSYVVELSVSASAARALCAIRPKTEHARLGPPDKGCASWLLSIDFEREEIAFSQVLSLGAGAEVLSPPALRARLASLGRALYDIYEDTPQKK